MTPRLFTIVLAITCGIAAPVLAGGPAHQGKVDRAIRASLKAGDRTQRVIITLQPGCLAGMRKSLEQHGDVIGSEHALIDALSGEVHSKDVDKIAKFPCVKAVSSDAVVSATPSSNGASTTPRVLAPTAAPAQTMTSTLRDTLGLPHYAALNPQVPTGATGITVAIIDSGITPSDDFVGRITGFYDFTKGNGRASTPYDDYGHGTHIAGLIGSSGQLSNYELQGVAPSVHLVALKVLDKEGSGKTSDVIKALEYVIANKAKLNVQIVNLSLGHPIYEIGRASCRERV
jgi:Subtilisin-like serine proteases